VTKSPDSDDASLAHPTARRIAATSHGSAPIAEVLFTAPLIDTSLRLQAVLASYP
jgi:hypothetical protein